MRRAAEADGRGVRLVGRVGGGSICYCRDHGGSLLAAAGVPLRPCKSHADHRAVPHRLWRGIRLAIAADATSLASLRGFLRARRGWERHGPDGVLASGVELVRETPRDGARHRDVW